MGNENILFYSKKCKFCSQIINLISDIDSLEKYKFICIDNERNKYPYIQRVPTLIIKQIKQPLIGINAFNWIKSTAHFNRITNNINAKPNKFINSKENPLLYDVNKGPNGMKNKHTSENNFTFIKNNINSIDNISYINSKQEDIYTLPEGSKIDKKNQKKKLNALMTRRAKQDFGLFGLDIDTKYSSDNYKINSNNDETNIMNNRINRINFSTEQQKNLPKITEKSNTGISTSRIIINKNNIKNNLY
jgi:hypothetical protein